MGGWTCVCFSLWEGVFSLSFYSGKCESPIGTCIIDLGFQTSETAAIWLEFEHFERSIFEIGGFHLYYPGYLKGLSYLSRYSSHRFLRRNCPWLMASILGKYGEEDARNTLYPLKKPIYFYIIITILYIYIDNSVWIVYPQRIQFWGTAMQTYQRLNFLTFLALLEPAGTEVPGLRVHPRDVSGARASCSLYLHTIGPIGLEMVRTWLTKVEHVENYIMIYQNSNLWTHKRKGLFKGPRVVLDLHRLARLRGQWDVCNELGSSQYIPMAITVIISTLW